MYRGNHNCVHTYSHLASKRITSSNVMFDVIKVFVSGVVTQSCPSGLSKFLSVIKGEKEEGFISSLLIGRKEVYEKSMHTSIFLARRRGVNFQMEPVWVNDLYSKLWPSARFRLGNILFVRLDISSYLDTTYTFSSFFFITPK